MNFCFKRIIPSLVLLITMVTLVALCMAQNAVLAPSVNAGTEDTATLSADNVINPVVDNAWVFSYAPWESTDNDRVLYFGDADDHFNAVAAYYEGTEVVKTLDCRIVAVQVGGIIEVATPDGQVYELENRDNRTVGDFYTVSFLLAAK